MHKRNHCNFTGATDGAETQLQESLAECGGIRSSCSPDEVGEAPVQVHGGRGAAEYGENAFQVQKLQLLAVTVEAQRQAKHKAK